MKLLKRSSSKVVGGGARSGSFGGGVIALMGITFAGSAWGAWGADACSNAASIDVGSAGFLSFHLHQLFLTEFLPGIDITEPVGDNGGRFASLSLSYVEFKLTLDKNLRILPGLVDAGEVGERGGVVASAVVMVAVASTSTS